MKILIIISLAVLLFLAVVGFVLYLSFRWVTNEMESAELDEEKVCGQMYERDNRE